MKTYTQFKNEINGYNDVRDTVEAEEKISVSVVRLIMSKNKALKKFNDELDIIINKFFIYNSSFVTGYADEKKSGSKKALLIIGGERGMVGNLWNNLVKFSGVKFSKYEKIIIFGKSVYDDFVFLNRKYANKSVLVNVRNKCGDELDEISNNIISIIESKNFDEVNIMWPHLITLDNFKPKVETIYPFKINRDINKNNFITDKDNLTLPIIRPNSKEFFRYISELFVLSKISQIIIEKQLSEALSRAVTMENAKNEVDKIIKKKKYNFLTERKKISTKNQIEVFMAHKIINKS